MLSSYTEVFIYLFFPGLPLKLAFVIDSYVVAPFPEDTKRLLLSLNETSESTLSVLGQYLNDISKEEKKLSMTFGIFPYWNIYHLKSSFAWFTINRMRCFFICFNPSLDEDYGTDPVQILKKYTNRFPFEIHDPDKKIYMYWVGPSGCIQVSKTLHCRIER